MKKKVAEKKIENEVKRDTLLKNLDNNPLNQWKEAPPTKDSTLFFGGFDFLGEADPICFDTNTDTKSLQRCSALGMGSDWSVHQVGKMGIGTAMLEVGLQIGQHAHKLKKCFSTIARVQEESKRKTGCISDPGFKAAYPTKSLDKLCGDMKDETDCENSLPNVLTKDA